MKTAKEIDPLSFVFMLSYIVSMSQFADNTWSPSHVQQWREKFVYTRATSVKQDMCNKLQQMQEKSCTNSSMSTDCDLRCFRVFSLINIAMHVNMLSDL